MNDEWEIVQSLPELAEDEVQIWRVVLPGAAQSQDAFRTHLPAEELERAKRMRVGQVSMQFVLARACLRTLLGNLLNIDAQSVPIALSPYGKPMLVAKEGQALHFNLAHSRETVLIALCNDGEVGVDLEYLDRETEVLDVAEKFLHPEEFQEIASIVDPELQRQVFFRCWTRKEAVVKADGRGLSLPLNCFKVPVSSPAIATGVRIVEVAGPLPRSSSAVSRTPGYYVSDLALGQEIAGAYAATLPRVVLRTLLFPLSSIAKVSRPA